MKAETTTRAARLNGDRHDFLGEQTSNLLQCFRHVTCNVEKGVLSRFPFFLSRLLYPVRRFQNNILYRDRGEKGWRCRNMV